MKTEDKDAIKAAVREALDEMLAGFGPYEARKAEVLKRETEAAAQAEATRADSRRWQEANRPLAWGEFDEKHGGGPVMELNNAWWLLPDGAMRTTAGTYGEYRHKEPPTDAAERYTLCVTYFSKRLAEVEKDLAAWRQYVAGGPSPATWHERRYPGFSRLNQHRVSRPASEHVAHLLTVALGVRQRLAELEEQRRTDPALAGVQRAPQSHGGTPRIDEMITFTT